MCGIYSSIMMNNWSSVNHKKVWLVFLCITILGEKLVKKVGDFSSLENDWHFF